MAKELSDIDYDKIESLSEEGNQFYEDGQFSKALRRYQKALNIVPDPKTDWEASTWLYTSIGDTQFAQADLEGAKDSYYDALNCPDGIGQGYIHFSMGQVLFELGELKKAKEYLLRAYMLEGEEIFEDENPKYLNHIKDMGLPPAISETEIEESLARAETYYKKGERDLVFKELENTFNNIPEPKSHYEASGSLLIKTVEYHNRYGNHDQAVQLIEKLDRYIYAGNEYELNLYKAKAYYMAGQKIAARKLFWTFINNDGIERFKKEYPEYLDMYIDSL
ncbi:hypothetical protein [Zobellia nedashkovskayae]|uniref:hypothetical protein n=1 Tax=Zobellia nedashkovskayae TaxID=2779510 RepID=UPI001D04FE01|nr:hypothetical protein [Zobellia nedashkovskayae]